MNTRRMEINKKMYEKLLEKLTIGLLQDLGEMFLSKITFVEARLLSRMKNNSLDEIQDEIEVCTRIG
jgi:hypothetical protein